MTEELEAQEPAAQSEAQAAQQPLAPPEPAAPAITPVKVSTSRPRASFDVDLGPDPSEVKAGGSEPIEPLIVGPGGTFGQNPLRPEPKPAPQPIVQDPVITDAADFFTKPEPPVQPETQPVSVSREIPAVPIQPAVPAARVSAENAVALR